MYLMDNGQHDTNTPKVHHLFNSGRCRLGFGWSVGISKDITNQPNLRLPHNFTDRTLIINNKLMK
jgi:hypothetical protein